MRHPKDKALVKNADMFLKGEKDFLRPLPERPLSMKERKLRTAGKNCYVSLFKHHYEEGA